MQHLPDDSGPQSNAPSFRASAQRRALPVNVRRGPITPRSRERGAELTAVIVGCQPQCLGQRLRTQPFWVEGRPSGSGVEARNATTKLRRRLPPVISLASITRERRAAASRQVFDISRRRRWHSAGVRALGGLALVKPRRAGCFQRRLVQGRTLTYQPRPPELAESHGRKADQSIWFHALLKHDGIPFSAPEVEMLEAHRRGKGAERSTSARSKWLRG